MKIAFNLDYLGWETCIDIITFCFFLVFFYSSWILPGAWLEIFMTFWISPENLLVRKVFCFRLFPLKPSFVGKTCGYFYALTPKNLEFPAKY